MSFMATSARFNRGFGRGWMIAAFLFLTFVP